MINCERGAFKLAQKDDTMPPSYIDRITIEPGKRSGQPCIRNMRITVDDVLGYLAGGMTEDEVLADFPYLTPEDILACHEFDALRNERIVYASKYRSQ